MIAESLFDMLSIKPLKNISISEISENAGIDRRTFYRHFKTKEDIICYYIHEISKNYEKIMLHTKATDNFSITKAFFEVCLSMKETLLILHKHNLLYLLLLELDVLSRKYQMRLADAEELKRANNDYILAYHMGGLWNLLNKWLGNNCKKKPEEMGRIVEQMLLSQQI